MLTLIVINVQYLKNVVFSFEKGWNGQNHFSSNSCNLLKKFPLKKCLTPPHHVHFFREPCMLNEGAGGRGGGGGQSRGGEKNLGGGSICMRTIFLVIAFAF